MTRSPFGPPIPPVRLVARAHTLVIALLCLLPPFFISYRLPTLHELTDNKWLVVIFLSACATGLSVAAWALSGNRRPAPLSALKAALLAGLLLSVGTRLFSALVSPLPSAALHAALPPIALAGLFLTLVLLPPSAAQIRKWAWLTILAGAVIGLLALLQHSGLDPLRALVRYRDTVRYRTGVYVTLGNPEYLGGYLAPVAMLALGMLIGGATGRSRAIAAAGCILAGWAAFLTGSRGAFLGMLAGGAVLLIVWLAQSPVFSHRMRRLAFAAAGCGLAMAVALVVFSPAGSRIAMMRARLGEIAQPYSESLRDRIVFNLVGLEMISRHPVFGIGPGRFGVEFYPALLAMAARDEGSAFAMIAREFNGAVAEHAHNDWLQIWAETGGVGFAAWLWFVIVWFVAIARALVHPVLSLPGRFLMLAAAAACVALLVNGVFNFPLHEPVRAALFWLCAAWSATLALYVPWEANVPRPAEP
ncbi:MAG: O-antigen ligase family protein [Candidatus Sumerlaeia bacterium]|nr:O-antigen ligase family protein [Candidatus Sumerlaeia bacterium]